MKASDLKRNPVEEAIREHIARGVPFSECMFRPGSAAFTEFYTRVREMRESLDLDWQDAELLDTDIGECIMIEGERVPLDVPIEEVELDEMAKKVLGEPGAYTMKQGKTEYKLTPRLNRNDRPSGEWQIYVKDRGNWEWDRTVGSKRDAINWIKTQKEEVELDEVTVANAAKAFDIKKQAVALKAKIAKLKNTPGDAAHMKMIDAKRSFDKKIAALQALDVDAYEIKKLKESSLDENLNQIKKHIDDLEFERKRMTPSGQESLDKLIKAKSIKDARKAFDDMYGYEYDRVTSSGQESMVKIGKMLGMKTEEVDLDEGKMKNTTMQANKPRFERKGQELEAYANKFGGVDKKDMMKVAAMLKRGDKSGAMKYAMGLDTDPKEYILNLIGEEVELDEAEYQGRKVKLNSPKRGGPKKFYVYVKNPKTGRVKKISWGDTSGLSVKAKDRGAVRSFVARHKCKQKNDKMKAGYWACRTPRYKALGVKGGAWW